MYPSQREKFPAKSCIPASIPLSQDDRQPSFTVPTYKAGKTQSEIGGFHAIILPIFPIFVNQIIERSVKSAVSNNDILYTSFFSLCVPHHSSSG